MGGIDPAAIAKAEAALKSLSGNFAQWLNDEIAKLESVRATVRSEGPSLENMESLYLRAHDLKGLGATYGFPLITRIAGLLCRLIDDKSKRLEAPMSLIDAHIDAIKAAVEQLFGVKVTGVWTSNARGKARRVGQSIGRRPHTKKAIVKLRDGDTIAIFEG
jgi:chemotaxis protein histidine kinase CheA